MKRILVCGGRDFRSFAFVDRHLRLVHEKHGISVVIEGDADGADRLAKRWAIMMGIPVETYPADWSGLGRRAGPIRNRRMLDEGKPDAVVAFPGGDGTRDMVNVARNKGVPVWAPGWKP